MPNLAMLTIRSGAVSNLLGSVSGERGTRTGSRQAMG